MKQVIVEMDLESQTLGGGRRRGGRAIGSMRRPEFLELKLHIEEV